MQELRSDVHSFLNWNYGGECVLFRYWVVKMITGQLNMLKKIVVCTLLLTGAISHSSRAGMLVDLDGKRNYPLGSVVENKVGDEAYFSLGNGRAIKILLAGTSKKEREILKRLGVTRIGKNDKIRFVTRRNLRW